MRRRTVVAVGMVLAVGAVGAWKFSGARTVQLFGTLVHRVETTEKVVALTFDDGPARAAGAAVLEVLEREGVKATFFFTGAEMAEHPGLADRFVRAGHELGNHSYSHRRMLLRTPRYIRSEVERTDSLIRRAGHTGPIHFRPPYGKKLFGLPLYLSREGRTTIMWDVEPDSYPEVGESADRIVAHVVERTRPGSIVLLHVMYSSRRESLRAVPGIIRELRARGFRFVTVSELLALQPRAS